jgi:hypothetical protein
MGRRQTDRAISFLPPFQRRLIIWSKDGIRLGQLAPAAIHAEAAGFFDSIAKLSPNSEAQRFIQKKALEISGAIRQTRALMLEQINSSIPWPLLAVLVFYWRGQSELGDGSV